MILREIMEDKKIRQLLKKYNNILKKLEEGGVIRSSKIVSEYGEYIASKTLKLKLTESPIQKGYDATKNGKKYEIKSRKTTKKGTATVLPKPNEIQLSTADFLVGVIFDYNWDVKHKVRIPMKEVKKILKEKNRLSVTKKLVQDYSV